MEVVAVAIGVGLAVAAFALWRGLDSVEREVRRLADTGSGSGTGELRAQVATLQHALQTQLSSVQQSVATQVGETHAALGDVRERLGTLQQQAQRVSDLAEDISSLQDLLKPPKLRGALGELFLERLLEDIVPGRYESQFEFPSTRTRVDAVVRIGDRLVSIDAKFPLEMFTELTEASEEERPVRRKAFVSAVKRHVDAIAERYLVPQDGTIDWALMYIPAEAVYYECIVRDAEGLELDRFCRQRHVIPVSPSTLQAFLAALLLGLQGMAIKENAKRIQEILGQLGQDVARLDTEHQKLGRHLDNARSVHDETARWIGRVGERLRQASAAPLPEAPTQPVLPLERDGDD